MCRAGVADPGEQFEEALLQRREEGGASAARLLSDSIQSCLSGTPLEEYQIVVRVYCNIAETSRVLSRSHLVGAEKRSLCPFAAGFTSSTENYDFVDAGDRPDAVLNKIHGEQDSQLTSRLATYFVCKAQNLPRRPQRKRVNYRPKC